MTTHLYCVLPGDDGELPSGLRGVMGGTVRTLPVDDLVAWVSDIEQGIPVTIEGVKAHDAVVAAALDTGSTPVPVRYGQRFDDDAACRQALERQSSSIRSILAALQGFVEMTLLLTPSTRRMVKDLQPVLPEMAAEGAGVGRRYLETLRAREAASGIVRQALDSLAQRLADAAQRFIGRAAVQDTVVRVPIRTVSHLVRRELVDEYKAAVETVEPSADSRFLLIGPRAPYSFSSLDREGSGFHGMKLAD